MGTIRKYKLKKDRLTATLLTLPFLLFVCAFFYVPLLGWALAFVHYKPGLSLFQSEFAGLYYFGLIFEDWRRFSRVLQNTLAISFLNILCAPLPALFAIFLSELKGWKFKKIVQTITTFPYFVSWVIVYALAYALFASNGVINQVLIAADLIERPTNLLGNPDAVWGFQTFLSVWKSLGWNAVIYFAAIAGIDTELYNAASVDGAGRFQRIRHVTVPGIVPAFLVILLLTISNLLSQGIDQYLAFYNSLVADKITVLDLHVYRLGLVTQDYSYATAVGIGKSLISIALLMTANALSKKLRGESLV